MRKVPGAFGDAFRAVQALPGAVPFQSAAPFSIVRGASPGNTGAFIDGVPVPLLYHLLLGPSVIHPELISRVDYFPGGAPARFGRAVGGSVSAETRAPEPSAHAHAQVRAFDAGALVESPFAGGRADALVAARYSYTAAALSLFSPGVDLGYWDYQARAGVDLGDGDRASVFAFGSHDRRGALTGLPHSFEADFHRLDLRYDRALRGGDRLRLAVTVGEDRSSNEQGTTSGRVARVRLETELAIGESARLRTGADAMFAHTDEGVPTSDVFTPELYPEHEEVATGAYADVVWRPVRRVQIIPGARVDLYDWRVGTSAASTIDAPTTVAVGFDPRLAARFEVLPRFAVTSTVGLYHQGPSFFVPAPGLNPPGFRDGLQSSLQRSAGVELALPRDVVATATVFWHEYRGVTSFTKCSFGAGGIDLTQGCIRTRSGGRTYGLELLVRRPLTKHLGGWIAYTLSRSLEQSATLDSSAAYSHALRPTVFDHTHVLNVVGSYDLGQRWSAGGRFVYYTGRPINYLGDRTTDFARLDLRLEKRWPFLSSGWIAVVLEGLNVTFAREEVSCIPQRRPSSTTCKPEYGTPVVLPSIGVEASF